MKLALLLLCCSLSFGLASAQSKKTKEIYNEATKLYKVQEYEAALLKFQEAYQITPTPELLFNIAQCYRLLERYEEALRSYRSFMLDSKDEALRGSANARIEEIEAILASTGSLRISSSRDPAQVYIDGVKKSETPMSVSNIIVGAHEIRLEKQGYLPYEETIQIEARQNYVLQALLSPEKQPPTYLVPGLLIGASAASGAGFLFLFATRENRDAAFEGKALGLLALTADLTLVGALVSGVYVGARRARAN